MNQRSLGTFMIKQRRSLFHGNGKKGHILYTPDSLLLTLYNYTLAPDNDSCRNLKILTLR